MKREVRLACVVWITILSAAVFASESFTTEEVDGVLYSFSTNMRGATIIGLNKLESANSNRLEIPSKLGGKRVRVIADEAFHGSFTGQRKYTPVGPIWVREQKDYLGFETVVLPKGLESIGRMAFYQCSDIVSIDIPDTVYEIGEKAFSCCQSLKRIVLPPGIEKISSGLFARSGLVSIEIPEDLLEIGEEAFECCENLKSITIPDSVRKIGGWAFKDCARLEKPKLPLDIKVHKNAFDGCGRYARYVSGKEDVLFEIKEQGEDSVVITDVRSPLSLECLEIPEKISGKVVVGFSLRGSIRGSSSRNGLLKGIEELERVSFPKTIISLSKSELRWLENARYVKLLGVTNIVDDAFQIFRHLEAVEIPAACRIGSDAFFGCVRLKSIVIPDTVTEIGQRAFSGCESLTNVIFSSSLAVIPYEAFKDCKSLGRLDLPENLQRIDSEAFCGCTQLQVESFPVALKSIGGRAFVGCTKIVRITFPEGFTSFGTDAFRDCTSLYEVCIPSSVKKLPSGLFYGCRALSMLKSGESLAKDYYLETAFVGCPVQVKLKQERERAEQERARAKQEEHERKRKEYERKQRDTERKQELAAKELEDSLDRMHREIEEKMREVESEMNGSGSNLFLWLLVIVVGSAAGIFVYAKKNGCSYAETLKKIVGKVRAMLSRFSRQTRLTSSDDAMSSKKDDMMAEQGSIKFTCPHCGQHLEADYSMVNVDLDCPACGHSINVPAPGSVRQADDTSHE